MRICPGITTTFVRELRLSLSGNYDPAVRFRWQFAWSDSVSNFSNKLRRESLRFREVVELADVLGYDIEWVPKETNRFLGRGGAAERTRVRVYTDASDTELATTRQKRKEGR